MRTRAAAEYGRYYDACLLIMTYRSPMPRRAGQNLMAEMIFIVPGAYLRWREWLTAM